MGSETDKGEELCGVICPEHGDPCSVCDGPDMAPLLHTLTLADHQAGKGQHICVSDVAEAHFWREDNG